MLLLRDSSITTRANKITIYLVLYSYILKCFVFINPKTNKITHQDVGQMDMHIRMCDELKHNEGDNPTIGIVLCSNTNEGIAKCFM